MIYWYGVRERPVSGSAAECDALGGGVMGEPLRAELYGGVEAIVGSVTGRPPVTAATLAAHDAAVRRAAAAAESFLPARFGQVFATAVDLEAALGAEAAALRQALALVRGCAQMTLRLFAPANVGAAQPALRAAAPSAAGEAVGAGEAAGAGTRFLSARRAAAAAARELPELDPERRRLAPFVRAERSRRSAIPGFVGTAYHLVRTTDLAAYQEEARALPALRATAGRYARLSGPWPPYAFAPEPLG